MDLSSIQVENIVRQVISEMNGNAAPTSSSSAKLPSTAKVAMLTGLEKIEVKEYPMPEVGDDDILVKVTEINEAEGKFNLTAKDLMKV
jgi:L-iditol 2-dehydrogenase